MPFSPDFTDANGYASTSLTIAVPTGSTGDELIAFVLSDAEVTGLSGYELEIGVLTGTPARWLHVMRKTRVASEPSPTFGFASATDSVGIMVDLPAGVTGTIAYGFLSGLSTYDVDIPRTTRPLAGVVWSEGSAALSVTPPGTGTHVEDSRVLDDGVSIQARMTAWAYEPGDTTPTYTVGTTGTDLRFVLVVGIRGRRFWSGTTGYTR